jgi:ferredoxin-type protein NapH
MGSMITRARKITRERVATQITALLVLNLPFLHLRGVCAPVFYCHSCPLVAIPMSGFACPLGVLVNFSALKLFPFITLGILGIVGVLGGRFVCGWLCPFGFFQDLLHRIPTRKFTLPHVTTYLKYAVLVGLVFAVPFFWPKSSYSFCNFCPAGTLESTIPWRFMGVASTLGKFVMRLSILIGVLGFAVVVSRGFCRTLCPLGAIFSVFNRFSLFRFHLAFERCNDCGVCEKKCPVDIHPVEQMNHEECIRCFDCTTNKHIEIGVK